MHFAKTWPIHNFQIIKGPLVNLRGWKSTLSGPHIPVPTLSFPLSTPLESSPNSFLSMLNHYLVVVKFEAQGILNEWVFYYFVYLKVNPDLEKNKSARWILTQLNFCVSESWPNLNPLNPAGRFSGLRKQGPRNPAGRFSGICYGVSKTRRAFKPAHVRLIIKWFVYTGRYQATLRSQVESSSLFSFLTICNLLTGFCTRYTNLRRKYGGDTQCMWRYRYSPHVMDNVEELYNQKIGFWDRNGGIHGTC